MAWQAESAQAQQRSPTEVEPDVISASADDGEPDILGVPSARACEREREAQRVYDRPIFWATIIGGALIVAATVVITAVVLSSSSSSPELDPPSFAGSVEL